jgi:hypothetical protein
VPIVLLPDTVPLVVLLVPPTPLAAPLPGDIATELPGVLPGDVAAESLGVLLALLLIPAGPLALLLLVPAGAAMLYFCSSSETRVLSADNCCRIASTSLEDGVGVATVVVDSVELLLDVGAPAPGAAGVVTT